MLELIRLTDFETVAVKLLLLYIFRAQAEEFTIFVSLQCFSKAILSIELVSLYSNI